VNPLKISSFVTEPLVIVKQPFGSGEENSAMVERGRELRLSCVAEGLPPPSYQWHVDGDPIPGACDPYFLLENFQ